MNDGFRARVMPGLLKMALISDPNRSDRGDKA